MRRTNVIGYILCYKDDNCGFLSQMSGRTCHLVTLVSWASSPLLIVIDLLCDRSLDGGKVSPGGKSSSATAHRRGAC